MNKLFGKYLQQPIAGLLGTTALALTVNPAFAEGAFDTALAFETNSYETITVTLDGAELNVRRYNIIYVGQPIEMAETQPSRGSGPGGGAPNLERRPLEDTLGYHRMFVYVPEAVVDDNETAIIMHVGNGGWFASGPRGRIKAGESYESTSDNDAIGAALAAGYVIADVGTRSRSAEAADGQMAGKAPAAIVDAKAAIRYLRLNDDIMPGSAERIVITGTSGGGALVVAVSASGNSADYYPYLAEIGAAGIDDAGNSSLADDVFVTIAYCPITDLANADIAYEWLYNAWRTTENTGGGDYSAVAKEASALLASRYPAYLESLGITLEDGTALTADTMADAIVAVLRRETEEHLAAGGEVVAIGESFSLTRRGETTDVINDWLTVENGEVTDINFANFLSFVTRAQSLKVVPAFDSTANTDHPYLRGENSLFGGPDVEYASYTKYGWDTNQVVGDGSGPDDTGMLWDEYIDAADTVLDDQIKMINPFAYLSTDADSAPHWYVRHGMVDRDTAFTISVALYHSLQNDPSVDDVSYELAWMTPHSGNYDVQEAYAWLASALSE